MTHGFGWISIVTLFAIVTMTSGGGVPALQTHAARHTTGQLEQLHIESASSRMTVAIAHCAKKKPNVILRII